MQSMSFAYFQHHIDEAMALLDSDEVCITRDSGNNAILVSEATWRTLQETMYLLGSPINADRLQASMQQAEVKQPSISNPE